MFSLEYSVTFAEIINKCKDISQNENFRHYSLRNANSEYLKIRLNLTNRPIVNVLDIKTSKVAKRE